MATIRREDFLTDEAYYYAVFKNEYNKAIAQGADPMVAWNAVKSAFNGLMPLNTTSISGSITKLNLESALAKFKGEIGLPLDFRGRQSGVKLKSWPGYPDIYPRLQLTIETVEGKDVYRLAFWGWTDNNVWLDFYGISYLPTGTQDHTGYWYVPLTEMERGRFLLGYNNARAAGKNVRDSIAEGRASMFFRNEIVYKVGDTVYNPFVNSNATMDAIPPGGEWVWKWVDGWNMLWCGVQEYIDKFLKVPYNVRDLVAFGESYENVMKNILLGKDRKVKMANYLGNIDFLAAPVGHRGFWDKLAGFAPAIMAGIVTVFTAGLGSPLLVAAGGLVAAALAKAGNQKRANDLNALLNQEYNNLDNVDKDAVENAKDDIADTRSPWTWLLLGGGALVYFLIKTRKGGKR